MNEVPDQGQSGTTEQPRVSIKIEEFCAALAMALICCITFANVVVRYFTNVSFAFTEEFSIFLMVVLTLFGAAAAFARDRHIRMTFFIDRLPRRVARAVECIVLVLSAALFAAIAWYGTRLFWDDWDYETTSPGIGIPQWIYTIWLPLLSVVILLRIAGRLVRFWRNPRARAGDGVRS